MLVSGRRFNRSAVGCALALALVCGPAASQSSPSAVAGAEPSALVSLAAVDSAPELAGDAGAVRSALLTRLRFAFGERNVVEGAASGAAIALRATLARRFGQYDLGVTATDRTTNVATSEHYRFTDLAAPTSAARLVALVDRGRAPRAATATPAPIVELAPLQGSPALRDVAVAATALLAARIHDASGATVISPASPDASTADPAIQNNLRLRIVGGLAHSGSAFDLYLVAYSVDRAPVDDVHVSLRGFATFPPATVFAPFVRTSLEEAPLGDPTTPVAVSVLPFASPPDVLDAAAVVRTALVDRMLAGNIAARAVSNASGPMSMSGTISRTPTGYRLELVGTATATGASVTTRADLVAPALVPPTAAVVEFVDAVKLARPRPEPEASSPPSKKHAKKTVPLPR